MDSTGTVWCTYTGTAAAGLSELGGTRWNMEADNLWQYRSMLLCVIGASASAGIHSISSPSHCLAKSPSFHTSRGPTSMSSGSREYDRVERRKEGKNPYQAQLVTPLHHSPFSLLQNRTSLLSALLPFHSLTITRQQTPAHQERPIFHALALSTTSELGEEIHTYPVVDQNSYIHTLPSPPHSTPLHPHYSHVPARLCPHHKTTMLHDK